jgi:phage I-like protein
MVAAATPSQTMKLETFNGVIENVNVPNKDVLVQYHHEKMNFSVNGNTKIWEGNKAVSLTDLNKGMWASVKYNEKGNQMLASVINVSAVTQPKHMTSSGMKPQSNQNKMMGSEKSTGMK